jgi:drug/metabolite transporter (DMT)-like permease
MSSRNYFRSGYLFAIAAAVLWGTAGPVAKLLFNQGVSALALTQTRQTMSFFFLMCFFLVWRRKFLYIRLKDLLFFAVLGIAGLAMVQISYYFAISKIQVAPAILLEYMAPVFILLYSATFAGEKITPAKVASLVLAIGGCALVAGIYKVDVFKLNLAGVAWGLLSAVFFSFYTLYGQAGLKNYNAMTLFAYASGFGSLFWWVLNPPQAFFAVEYSSLTWLLFVYVALFGTILPFVLYFEALKRMEASRVSLTSTLEPVVAGVVAYLLVGETMAFLQIIGGILVLSGIVLLQQSPSPVPQADKKAPAQVL